MRPLYESWVLGSDPQIGKGIRMAKQKALPLFVRSKNRLWHQLPETDKQRVAALYAELTGRAVRKRRSSSSLIDGGSDGTREEN